MDASRESRVTSRKSKVTKSKSRKSKSINDETGRGRDPAVFLLSRRLGLGAKRMGAMEDRGCGWLAPWSFIVDKKEGEGKYRIHHRWFVRTEAGACPRL